jgi:hypothetical protein
MEFKTTREALSTKGVNLTPGRALTLEEEKEVIRRLTPSQIPNLTPFDPRVPGAASLEKKADFLRTWRK